MNGRGYRTSLHAMPHDALVPLNEARSVLAGVDRHTGAAYALKVLDGRPGPLARRRIEARLRRLLRVERRDGWRESYPGA